MNDKNNRFSKRIHALLVALLVALMLLNVCPIAAFAGSKTAQTTASSATATAYCRKYPSCQGKHAVRDCPGPQPVTSKVKVGNVEYTVAATKPSTASATTVTVTAAGKATYSYTVSADNKTITERKNGAVTRTASVADYVDVNAPARTTKLKKDGKFGYQTISTTQMKIWKDNGAKVTIIKTKDNAAAFDAYNKAIDEHISAYNLALAAGIGAGVAVVALVAIYFINPVLGVAATGEVIKAIIGVSATAAVSGGVGCVTLSSKSNDNYNLARKYYFMLIGG